MTEHCRWYWASHGCDLEDPEHSGDHQCLYDECPEHRTFCPVECEAELTVMVCSSIPRGGDAWLSVFGGGSDPDSDRLELDRCGIYSPGDNGLPCELTRGHEEPHRNSQTGVWTTTEETTS